MKISKDKMHGWSFSKRALLCVIFVLLPIIHFLLGFIKQKYRQREISLGSSVFRNHVFFEVSHQKISILLYTVYQQSI